MWTKSLSYAHHEIHEIHERDAESAKHFKTLPGDFLCVLCVFAVKWEFNFVHLLNSAKAWESLARTLEFFSNEILKDKFRPPWNSGFGVSLGGEGKWRGIFQKWYKFTQFHLVCQVFSGG